MPQVINIKTLEARIEELEAGPRSIKEDFYLAVMRELLDRLEREPDEWDALFKEEKAFQPAR